MRGVGRTRAAFASIAAIAVVAGGCGDSSTSSSTTTTTSSSTTTKEANKPAPEVPTASGIDSCISNLFSQLGAGGVAGTAVPSPNGSIQPALPKLAEKAESAFHVFAGTVDPKNDPVELYFFATSNDAGAQLQAGQQEVAQTSAVKGDGTSGVSGSVFYVVEGSLESKARDAINTCLKQQGADTVIGKLNCSSLLTGSDEEHSVESTPAAGGGDGVHRLSREINAR